MKDEVGRSRGTKVTEESLRMICDVVNELFVDNVDVERLSAAITANLDLVSYDIHSVSCFHGVHPEGPRFHQRVEGSCVRRLAAKQQARSL